MALNNNLTVTGKTTLRGALDFARFDDTQAYRNKITTNLNGLTIVGRTTTLSGDTEIKGTTTAQKKITINSGGLEVVKNGVTIKAGGLTVTGNTNLNNGLTVKGNTVLNNPLTVKGFTELQSDLYISGHTEINNGLTINRGGVRISAGGLNVVGGNTNLYSGLFVSTGGLFVNKGGLTVTGNTTLNNKLTVKSNLIVTGFENNVSIFNKERNNYPGYNNSVYDHIISHIRLVSDVINKDHDKNTLSQNSGDYFSINRYIPCDYTNEGTLAYYREYETFNKHRAYGKFKGCVCTLNYASASQTKPNFYKCGWVDVSSSAFLEATDAASTANGRYSINTNSNY